VCHHFHSSWVLPSSSRVDWCLIPTRCAMPSWDDRSRRLMPVLLVCSLLLCDFFQS
jgi:hypothetical protein